MDTMYNRSLIVVTNVLAYLFFFAQIWNLSTLYDYHSITMSWMVCFSFLFFSNGTLILKTGAQFFNGKKTEYQNSIEHQYQFVLSSKCIVSSNFFFLFLYWMLIFFFFFLLLFLQTSLLHQFIQFSDIFCPSIVLFYFFFILF